MNDKISRHLSPLIAVILASFALLTACGSDPAPDPGGGTSPTESEGQPVQENLERVESRLIPEDGLPEPWRLSEKPDDSFRRTICGVENEPEEPMAATARKFAQSALGPFVQQKVRLHRAGVAESVVQDLRQALRTCTEYETSERYVVENVDFVGIPDNAVAMRLVPQRDGALANDVAYIADGDYLISIVSVSLQPPPDPSYLGLAIAAIPEGE